MPISVDYQPPMQGIADAAYIGGMGEYLDKLAQRNLQRQQLDLQNQHFQQDLAARLYQQQQNQLANQNALVFHAGQQQSQNAFNKDFQESRDIWNRQNQTEDFQKQLDAHRQDAQSQREWQAQQVPVLHAFDSAQRGSDDLEKEINGTLANYAKQRKYMNEVGVNALNELYGKYRAIQAVRDWGRPQQYASALGKFMGEVSRADIQQHVEIPKSIQEQVEQDGGAYTQPVNTPDGQFMGHNVWTQTMRNGVPNLAVKFVPHRPDPTLPFKQAKSTEEYWAALKPTEQNAIYTSTVREMMANSDSTTALSPQTVMDAVHKKLAAMHGLDKEPTSEREQHQQAWDEFKKKFPQGAAHYEQILGGPPVPSGPEPTQGQPQPQQQQPPPQQAAPPQQVAPQAPPPTVPTRVVSQQAPQPVQPPPTQESAALKRPPTGRDAYSAVRQAQAARDGESRLPDPSNMSDADVYRHLNSPAVKRIMAEQGIVNPTQPPPAAHTIHPGAQGDAALRKLLDENPAGVVIIDARDGKRKFISRAMLEK